MTLESSPSRSECRRSAPASRLDRLALAGAAALLLGAPAVAQDEEVDRVFLRDGTSEVGKVLEESYAGVEIQPERGKKTLPWEAVQSVQYFDAPEELGAGLATLGAGNLDAALAQFEALVADAAELRPVIVQQGLFHVAYLKQRLGQTAEAIAGYGELLQKFPQGRYLRQAGENLMRLHLAQGNPAAAEQALSQLAEGAQGVPGVEAEVGILRAWLLEAQQQHGPARDGYAAVESLAGAPPTLVQEARLGRARTLLAEGKAGEAEPLFRALTLEQGLSRVQSGAWNGLGEIQATDGKTRRDADRILEALYAYLRTLVQYKPLTGEGTEEYERALAGAATCFQYLSELEQNPERKRLLRDRSRERNEQLEREFPNSLFKNKG